MEESVLLTALHRRAWWTDTSLVNVQTRRRGWTPLMIAAELGDLKLVEHLLDAGADTRLVDSRGWTALIWAVARDRAAICECFLAYNLPTQAEISAAFSVAIRLHSARSIGVFLDRTRASMAPMATLAIQIGNASALRMIARSGRIHPKTSEPGSGKSLRALARQAGPSMQQALLDGAAWAHLQATGFRVRLNDGQRSSTGLAFATADALQVRFRSPLKLLGRLLVSKRAPAADLSLEWTNEVRFQVQERQVQIQFPGAVVSILEPANVWLCQQVCRVAAYKHCGAMPFQDRLEALIRSDLLGSDAFLTQCSDLIADLETARDQMTVCQQEVNRRCALAASLGRDPASSEAETWRRLQRQIDLCEHYQRTAKELRLRKRGDLRARCRTTPASSSSLSPDGTGTGWVAYPDVEGAATDESDQQYERLCVVCWSNRKNYLTMPCRHLCLCRGCFVATRWKRCPVCNDPVTEIIRIFL